MNVDKKYTRRGLEGTRRATAIPVDESPQGTASPRPAVIVPPDPEVVAKPTRRRFTAEDTLRILKLADACTAMGSLGALLRAEGLYASNLTTWRRQRTEGVLSALAPLKRGRKASARHPLRAENETLRKENVRLARRLKQAELIIDVQKKSHRSWASPWRRPRKAGAPDGRHAVTVHGDRDQAGLCRLRPRPLRVLSWAGTCDGARPASEPAADLVGRGAAGGPRDLTQRPLCRSGPGHGLRHPA